MPMLMAIYFLKRWSKHLDMVLELVSSSKACLQEQAKLISCLSLDLAKLDAMCISKLQHLQAILLLEIMSCSNVKRDTLGFTCSPLLACFSPVPFCSSQCRLLSIKTRSTHKSPCCFWRLYSPSVASHQAESLGTDLSSLPFSGVNISRMPNCSV